MRIPKDPPDSRIILQDLKKRETFIKYFDRKDINEYINQINHRYLYWEEITFRSKPENTTYELLWAFIKFSRNIDIESLELSEIDNFKFKYKIIPRFLEKLHELDLYLGGSIGTPSIIPDVDKERFLISSLMEEAIASSQLEGAATTRKVAKDMLRTARKPKNKSELMILNNYITINHLLKMRDKKITPELILKIHALITTGTLEDKSYEGRFRDTNDVHVVDSSTGKIYYTPPNYNYIAKLIDELCIFINNESKKKFMHPIIKASIIHFLIGYIHPFVDGNGRTARAIFYWYLLSKGYWLVEFMSISKTIIKAPSKYARAYMYTEKDGNDLTYFISFQIRTLDLALKDLKNYIQRKIKEKDQLYDLLQVEGLNPRQIQIIKKFSDNPKLVMTINEVKNTYNVVKQTARTDLLTLVKMGFLRKSRIGKKKLIFLRSDKFESLLKK